jgi:hypothetical protein
MQAQLTKSKGAATTTTGNPAAQESVTAAVPAQVPTDDRRVDAIRQAAYFLYEARGFACGHELEDWLNAEAAVDAVVQQELAEPSSAAASAPTRP